MEALWVILLAQCYSTTPQESVSLKDRYDLSLTIQILKSILWRFWRSHLYKLFSLQLWDKTPQDYKRHLEGTFLRGFSDKSTLKIKASWADFNYLLKQHPKLSISYQRRCNVPFKTIAVKLKEIILVLTITFTYLTGQSFKTIPEAEF